MKCERIEDNDGILLALVVRREDQLPDGVEFVTDPADGLQVGFIRHPKGRTVQPHKHRLRTYASTTSNIEVLEVRSGRVQVDFYPVSQSVGGYCQSRILLPGDILVQLAGGHGFRWLEESEVLEVRQGPYIGRESDKEML